MSRDYLLWLRDTTCITIEKSLVVYFALCNDGHNIVHFFDKILSFARQNRDFNLIDQVADENFFLGIFRPALKCIK